MYYMGSSVLHFARNIAKFCRMSIHIGSYIHDLIKQKGLKAKAVARAVNMSESSLYKIYNRDTIDVDKLIKFSQYLDTNLFLQYLEQEPLKSMFRQETRLLQDELAGLRSALLQKDRRIAELESINSSQQKIIALLENPGEKK